jgi:hypothetical protein
VITSILNLIAASFTTDSTSPLVLKYQGVLAMKHIMEAESLDLVFREKLIEITVPQIATSNYELFFDIIYSMMK